MITQEQETFKGLGWPLSECLSCTVQPLCEYLRRANDLASIQDQAKDSFNPLQRLLDELGLIVVSREGCIHFMTLQAENLLHKYSLGDPSQVLPEGIQHWLDSQSAQSLDQEHGSPPNPSLNIEQDGQRLVIRSIPDTEQGQYFLLLEEQPISAFTVDALELLGLTKREAEVLFWIAKDKSNAGIARVLGCCEGTIRKHLENLYKKLDVQTRMGAVMTALERLGLLEA